MSESVKAAQIRSDNNHYTRLERDGWRRKEQEIKESFCADLAAEYLPDVPKVITDFVFSKAWEEGHSAGYQSVAGEYEELAELVLMIMKVYDE
jgi:hypothetical protein